MSRNKIWVIDDDRAMRWVLEKTFKEYGKKIAAVIIEPHPANAGLLLQDPNFLKRIRELCTENKSLLIHDEVISGFRVGFHRF